MQGRYSRGCGNAKRAPTCEPSLRLSPPSRWRVAPLRTGHLFRNSDCPSVAHVSVGNADRLKSTTLMAR